MRAGDGARPTNATNRAALAACAVGLVLALAAVPAAAQAPWPAWPAPDGAALVRLLGSHAAAAFAVPGAAGRGIHARAILPAGAHGSDYGLPELAPGFARLSGSPSEVLAFADRYPEVRLEVTPPLHPLLDTAAGFVAASAGASQGLDGTGVLVGVADTGLDLQHPDFRDAQGHTRVAWFLDLSAPPRGVFPDLEQMFGTPAASDTTGPSGGSVVAGAVWSGQEIDDALASGDTSSLPTDEIGHGTLVSACAAANDVTGASPYRGIAPGATLVLARITSVGTEAIDTDDLLRAVGFLYDRADAMGEPIVVNLSLGTDFGPHDGTTAWEQSLASFVGPGHPGRALVAAAGNSGSIGPEDGTLVHQNVHVNEGTTMRVPLETGGASNGGVEVWVAMHAGASLRIGLDGPDGTWIGPVASGSSAGKDHGGYAVAVYNGAEANSPVPATSHGGVVVWQGAWPGGEYAITLAGSGTADLYLEATGDASGPHGGPVGFAYGVREGTVNLPATSPSIIGVGCTINKASWMSQDGDVEDVDVPILDPTGMLPAANGASRIAAAGEPCWFSSAGPTLTGLAKPEIMAPGAAIVGALSANAFPPSPNSIFSLAACAASDPTCQVVDSRHGASLGTSFSTPLVSGAVALLFQRDPTLTQDAVLAALQGGVHPLRGAAPFDDQAGAGELDVGGALTAVADMATTQLVLPDRGASWMTLGADVFLADGSTPLQAVLELRGAASGGAPPPADGFAPERLQPYAKVDGAPQPGAVQLARRGPGVWIATVQLPAGLGGSSLAVGATFDGAPVVGEKVIPIATDLWTAAYPTTVGGGCAVAGRPVRRGAARGLLTLALVAAARRLSRRRARSLLSRMRKLFDLGGKVALITGSSRGIGRAIAEAMAVFGAKVVVSSRKPAACEEVKDAIVAKGGEAAVVPCNIGSKEELQRLVDETNRIYGPVDVLVCNAAVNPHFGPTQDIPDSAFDKIMASNVRSNHWLCQMTIPSMAARGGGSVILVSSIGGLKGSTVLGAYGISKAADMQMARNLAVEWGPQNVRVNCIAPGLVRTDFARALWENPQIYEATVRTYPLRRIGEPNEIAGAAVFLASSAGSFTTGQTIVIDGGSTIAS